MINFIVIFTFNAFLNYVFFLFTFVCSFVVSSSITPVCAWICIYTCLSLSLFHPLSLALSRCVCVWVYLYWARVLLQFFLSHCALICDYLYHLNGFAFMTIIITTENNSYIQKSRNVNFYPNLSAKGVQHVAKYLSFSLSLLLFRFHPLHTLKLCSVHVQSVGWSSRECPFFSSFGCHSTKMTFSNSVLAL